MKFFKLLAAILAAPFVMTWDGFRWVARRLAPQPIPDVATEVDEILDGAEAAPVAPRRLGEIVHDVVNAMVHGGPMPADIAAVPERVEAWLHRLDTPELARLQNMSAGVIEDHVSGFGHILRVPVMPSVAAYEKRLALQRLDAEIAEEKRRYDSSILQELIDGEDEPEAKSA